MYPSCLDLYRLLITTAKLLLAKDQEFLKELIEMIAGCESVSLLIKIKGKNSKLNIIPFRMRLFSSLGRPFLSFFHFAKHSPQSVSTSTGQLLLTIPDPLNSGSSESENKQNQIVVWHYLLMNISQIINQINNKYTKLAVRHQLSKF